MKFLLIGDGFIASKHKESIKKIGGEIVGIVDKNFGEDKWKEEILKTNADCVVILVPNDLHFSISKFALENNKIVLCEKPLVIKSKDIERLVKYRNIFTVLQLRHHPDVAKIKKELMNMPVGKKSEIEMDISVFRDENYYKSWKGQKERSGGVLFNLGVHYFDLLIHLFGLPKNVRLVSLDDKTGTGIIEGEKYTCNFKVSTDENRKSQRRVFKINGKQYNFCSKDNLSFENLHKFVYSDLLVGKGVMPSEALNAIKLIENLYQSYES